MRFLVFTTLSAILAAPAFAADLGTYRPGTPYHSTIVPGADVCESQCAGDARCRGWNYVKATPSAPGVCEFQSSVGEPISSAVSISGLSRSAMPMPGRVIAGNTNTIRVGTAVAPQPQETRIIRQPVPAPSAAHHSAGHVAQPPRAFQPMLDGQTHRIIAPSQPTISRGPARRAPQSQQFRAAQPQMTRQPQPRNLSRSQPQRMTYQGRPPIGQPIPAPQSYQSQQARIQNAPVSQERMSQSGVPQYQPQARQIISQPAPIQQTPASAVMPRSSVSNPIGFNQAAPANTNIYGRLNDDVPSRTVPVPQGYARPVAPVQQSQLAGAPR